MTEYERITRAALHTEWLVHKANAESFGSANPGAVADILTYGRVLPANLPKKQDKRS